MACRTAKLSGISRSGSIAFRSLSWGLSAEAGYEQLFTTHVGQSDLYKNTFYADAKDGWYAFSGSTARVGLRGGARIGVFEIFARAGLDATGQLHALTPPFYGTLGTTAAF